MKTNNGEPADGPGLELTTACVPQERQDEHGRILVHLARSEAFAKGDVLAAFRQLTEVAANVLSVQRVSLWLYDEAPAGIRCVDLFESGGGHSWGSELRAESYPVYFASLEDARTLTAHDVRSDSRTRELLDGYLSPLGITSMLDVPIRSAGRMVGIVCHEHVGSARVWSANEQHFASSIGDLAALALETAERQRAVEALQRSEANFRSLIEGTSDLVLVSGPDGMVRYASPSHERLLGFKTSELIGTPAIARCHPDDREKFLRIANQSRSAPWEAVACELRLGTIDGGWRVFDVVVRNLLADPIIGGFVVNGHDVTDRRREEQEKDALLAISRDVSGTLDLEHLLERVLAKTAALFGCGVAAMLRLEGGYFRPVATHGLAAEVAGRLALQFKFESNNSASEEDAVWGSVAFVNEIGQSGLVFADACTAMDITSLMVARVHVRGRLTGALAVGHQRHRGVFEARQVPVLEGIARQLGVAMEAADLYAAQSQDAAVAAALARVGTSMISSLDTKVLLRELCQVTTEVLGCDYSQTFLLRPELDTLELFSSYGESPEQREVNGKIRMENVSRSSLMGDLRRHDLVERRLQAIPDSPLAELGRSFGINHVLCIGLWRGGELVGVQAAGFRGGNQEFSGRHQRIARGIGHLASLALANAGLVEELATADRRKSEFVATLSHELRTPLNVIVGYMDMLLDENDSTAADVAEIMQRVRQSALALYDLITSTLDFSRVEAGGGEAAISDTDVGALLAEVANEANRTHGKPGVVLEAAPVTPAILLRTDRAKLRVVLANLVSNALKFTDYGRVTVSAAMASGAGSLVEIVIADTGIGIAREALEKIFEPFQQVSTPGGIHRGGFGLGLHIVRRLLGQIAGTIDVESELRIGTTFRIQLSSM